MDPLMERIEECLEPHQVLITSEQLKTYPHLFDSVDPVPWYIVKDVHGNYDFGSMNALTKSRNSHFTIMKKVFIAEWAHFDDMAPGYMMGADEYLENPAMYVVFDMAAKVRPVDTPDTPSGSTMIISIEKYKALPDMYDLIEVVYAVRQKVPEEFGPDETPHTG